MLLHFNQAYLRRVVEDMKFWESEIAFWRAEPNCLKQELKSERELTQACKRWADSYEDMLYESKIIYKMRERMAQEQADQGKDYFGFDILTGQKCNPYLKKTKANPQ